MENIKAKVKINKLINDFCKDQLFFYNPSEIEKELNIINSVIIKFIDNYDNEEIKLIKKLISYP